MNLIKELSQINRQYQVELADLISSGTVEAHVIRELAKQVHIQEKYPSHIAYVYLALEEKQLEERLKSLQIDMQNIAGVIAATTRKTEKEIFDAMVERTTLNPEQAREFGLVHEIKEELIEPGADLISIVQN